MVSKLVSNKCLSRTNNKHTTNVKNQDTIKCPPDGNGDVFPWVFCFADSYTNKFRPDIGKKSICHGTPETNEDGKVFIVYLLQKIVPHGTSRVLPVAETNAVMLGISAEINHYPHDQETYESYDFDAAKPEFQFSEYPDAKQINNEDWYSRCVSDSVYLRDRLTEGNEYGWRA